MNTPNQLILSDIVKVILAIAFVNYLKLKFLENIP